MSITAVSTGIQHGTQQAVGNVVSDTELQETLGGMLGQQYMLADVIAARVMLTCWRPRCLQ